MKIKELLEELDHGFSDPVINEAARAIRDLLKIAQEMVDKDYGACCGYDAYGCGMNCRFCDKIIYNKGSHSSNCPYRLAEELLKDT